MPEAENRRLFQRYFDDAANGGNLDLLEEIFATDYLHHDPANPDPRPVVGPQGVRDHLVSLMGAFPDLKFEVDDMVAQGDEIVVRWTARGTNTGDYFGMPATGKSIEITGMNTWNDTRRQGDRGLGQPRRHGAPAAARRRPCARLRRARLTA